MSVVIDVLIRGDGRAVIGRGWFVADGPEDFPRNGHDPGDEDRSVDDVPQFCAELAAFRRDPLPSNERVSAFIRKLVKADPRHTWPAWMDAGERAFAKKWELPPDIEPHQLRAMRMRYGE